jgi:hypothetical protein
MGNVSARKNGIPIMGSPRHHNNNMASNNTPNKDNITIEER